MKRFAVEISRHSLADVLVCAFISLAIAASVFGLRKVGALQRFEWVTYDLFVREWQPATPAETAVTLVGLTEPDIHELKHYPLSDGDFADLLNRLLEENPRAIGIDFFRDIPTPPGTDKLNEVLLAHDNIVWINKLKHSQSEIGVPGPPVLEQHRPDQLGFNDLPVDDDHVVRRALLYADDVDENTNDSLALRLALLYLKPQHIAEAADPVQKDFLRLGQTTFIPIENGFGPYATSDPAVFQGYQFPLDYASAARFPTFSQSAARRGMIPSEAIKDKIVLVGPMTVSINDLVNTPVADEQFGVQAHANAVDQIIRAATLGTAPMRSWSAMQMHGWLVLWSLMGGLLGLSVRSPYHFLVWAVCGTAAIAGMSILGFQQQLFIPAIPPALAWFASAGIATSYMSYRELKDRRALMTLFGRHVSRDVANTIWSNRDELFEKGRLIALEMEASILFTDLKGFSLVSEKMGPGVLMNWLNDYFQSMSGLVEQHGGSINKFNGDQIMALFGPPLVRSMPEEIAQDAANAVDCALAMRQKLAELNKVWTSENRPNTQMRIGICTGRVVAGSLGSKERLEYTVIGETVNVASRLESYDKNLMESDIAAQGCRILVSDSTKRQLDAKYRTRSIGSVHLHGMLNEVVVHGVIGVDVTSAPPTTAYDTSDRSRESCEIPTS